MDQNISTAAKRLDAQGITQRKPSATYDQLFTAGGKDMFDSSYNLSTHLDEYRTLTPSNANKAQP